MTEKHYIQSLAKTMTTAQHIVLAALLAMAGAVSTAAAPNDWGEGTSSRSDGATRDYYNRAGLLTWRHRMGDWRDAATPRRVFGGRRDHRNGLCRKPRS